MGFMISSKFLGPKSDNYDKAKYQTYESATQSYILFLKVQQINILGTMLDFQASLVSHFSLVHFEHVSHFPWSMSLSLYLVLHF